MNLYSQIYPEHINLSDVGDDTLVIVLPGLFGSTTNWRSLARQLGEHHPVIVLDQRNHGRSPHFDSHTYLDMVEDLAQFCAQNHLKKCHLIGHSMGGKVAMLFALLHPSLVEHLMVLDIAPVEYKHSHAPYIEAILKLDLTQLQSRSQADKMLQASIPDTATRLFLLQSLTGSPGNYRWRLNFPVLLEYMSDIVAFPTVEKQSTVAAYFIAGADSDYLLPKHHADIQQLFPNARFSSIDGAGHWLHAEKPAEVLKTIVNIIQI